MKFSPKPSMFRLSPEGLLGRLALATLLGGASTLAMAQAVDPTPPASSSTPGTNPATQFRPEANTSTAPSQVDGNSVELERVVVTGSNIARTSKETASPIQVISRREIEQTGKQSVSEVIRQITADNQGSIPTAFGNGFASGAAAVSLRGLGVSSTLVLVNGRRTASYGLADDGAHTFVDLNTLPLEAVDHIEVLKDGASSIYGSDAVGGVVNVILRRTFVGATLAGTGGISQEKDGNTGRISGSVGFGDLGVDRFNVFVTAEYQHEKAIYNRDRGDWLGTRDLRPYGGYDLRPGADSYNPSVGYFNDGSNGFSGYTANGTVRAPGTGAGATANPGNRLNTTQCPGGPRNSRGVCIFDDIKYFQIQPEVRRRNIYSRGTFEISPTIQAYTELGYFQSEALSQTTPATALAGGTYNGLNPFNPYFPQVQPTLPANHPDNPTGIARPLSYRTADVGPRTNDTDNSVTRLLTGIKGSGYGWDYELGALYARSAVDETRNGYINVSVLQQGLNSGVYRLNNRAAVPQSFYDQLSPSLSSLSTNSIGLVDLKGSRELFALPGGPLAVALGTEYRHEQSNSPAFPGTDNGSIAGLGYSAFRASRNIYAAYAEFLAPVFKGVEISPAIRYDHYSDYGNSTTPKVGVKFTPVKQFAIRGTYSQAFRAPGPAENGNAAAFGFTGIAVVTRGNPNIQPEKAKSFTAGIVTEPFTGLTATADYYHIRRRNEILAPDQGRIIGTNSTGPVNSIGPGALANSQIIYGDTGQITGVIGQYENANSTTTSGVDVNLRYQLGLGRFGKLTTDNNWTHVLKYERETPDGKTTDYVGTHGPYALSSASGTPRDRIVGSLTWDPAPAFSLTARVNYVAKLKVLDNAGETASLVTVQPTGGPVLQYTRTDQAEFNYFRGAALQSGTCAYYGADNRPLNGNCIIHSFTSFDLFGRVNLDPSLTLTGSIQNLFNRIAPFDPYTYGATNYNSGFHQDGAVGRFYRLGLRYTYK